MENNYLITGGAGFIGTNLVHCLMGRSAKIGILDNLSTGKSEDLAKLPVELKIGDIRDERLVDAAMQGIRVVIHLAAHTGVIDSVEAPELDMSINVGGTLNLLKAAVRHRVERFIFASTGGAVIGNADPPIYEEMVPRPISPYGASKLAGEGYCSAFWGSYGLKTVALRFSNAYGPFSYQKGSVIAKFFRQIQLGEELTIYGNGEQTRDFIYVADLCEAIMTSASVDLPFGRPIQLGRGRETSINQLLALMSQVVGQDGILKWKNVPTRPGEVQRNFVSIALAQKLLHFSPKTDLKEGLIRTWAWFQSQRS